MMGKRLEGKVALVTGAGRGMGAAIATLFAQHGAAVAVNDVQPSLAEEVVRGIAQAGGKAIALPGDCAQEADAREIVSASVRQFGALHILVNNAGILRPTRVEQITTAEYDLVINVCMRSCFLFSREVIPIMKKQGWGRIVNMSSSAGRSVSTLGGCHYTAAKAGMLGLTRAIAREVALFGITVNAICPGLINTEMVRQTVPPDRIRKYEVSFPIPRLGTPEEVADLALFLASDESSYITGASLDINGGDLMM
jgi:NAD(P)-dependent dehydrogenase (short-subunit alcohol dehydrogenase family)